MRYLLWLLLFPGILTLIIWLLNFRVLWGRRKTLGLSIFFALIFSIPWDILAIQKRIWNFPPGTSLPFRVLSLPIEEYLFIILVTLLLGSVTLSFKYRKKS